MVRSGSVILGDGLTARVRVERAGHGLEDGLPVEEWLVDVIGAPLAILAVVRDGSHETPDALIHIDLVQ